MKTIVCLHPWSCIRLGLLESFGGRRRVFPSLRATGHAQKGDVYGVQRRAIKEEANQGRAAAFTELCLRRLGNRHLRSLRSYVNSGLCRVCSHQHCWAGRASLEEQTHLTEIQWVGRKTSLQAIVIFFYPPTLNFSTYRSRDLLLNIV